MGNTTTLETAKSEDKKILQGITYKDFVAVCEEYQVVEKSVKELLSIADDFNTEPKEKISIYKWLVEMNTGKPKQITDITTGSKPTQVSFDLLDNNTELQISEVLGNKE